MPIIRDKNHPRQTFKIHLVNNPGVRRNDLEVAERLLPPAEEGIALAIALELHLLVDAERIRRAEGIDLHGMVDDQLGRQQRVDARRIVAQAPHGIAHGGQIDDGGHAGEVLKQHARRHEGDFLRRCRLRVPAGHGKDVFGLDGDAVLGAQKVFEQDLE